MQTRKLCGYKRLLTVVCLGFFMQGALASEKEFVSGKLRVLVNEQTGGFRLLRGDALILENQLKLFRGATNMAKALAPGAELAAVPAPMLDGRRLDGTWIHLKGQTDNGVFSIVRTIVLTPTNIRSTVRIRQPLEDKTNTQLQEDVLLARTIFDASPYKAVPAGREYTEGLLGRTNSSWRAHLDVCMQVVTPQLGRVYFFGRGRRHGRWSIESGKGNKEYIPLSFYNRFDSQLHGEFSVNYWELDLGSSRELPPPTEEFKFDAMNPADWKPENMDIYYDSTERLYLHGAWKVMPVKDSAGNPAEDQGTKDKVFLPACDDSRWIRYPVPYIWNVSMFYVTNQNEKVCIAVHDGVVWYRRWVNIPQYDASQRVILHFDNVQTEATVFVNGQRAGYHRNAGRLLSGISDIPTREPFEFDVTKNILPGTNNLIAVRIYLSPPIRYDYRGGIVGMAYIDIRPIVYAENIRLTPNLADSSVRIGADIVNCGSSGTTLTPEVRIEPWKSKRYCMAGGKSYSETMKPITAKPGSTRVEWVMAMPNAELWSPEHPFLYRCSILDQRVIAAGRRPAGLLGMARFGMRSFEVVGKEFRLNGHPIWLAGISSCLNLYVPAFPSYFNADHHLERWVERSKEWVGANMHRFWTPSFGCVFDICDEKGLMAQTGATINYVQYRNMMEGSREDQADIGTLADTLTAYCYNHPAVVTYDLGNEFYDYASGGTSYKAIKLGKPLTYAYNEIKKHDPTRPISNGSGRSAGASIGAGSNEPSLTDFFECHNYLHDIVDYDRVSLSFYDNYVKSFGKEAPLVNGEWGYHPNNWGHPNLMGWADDFLLGDRDGIFDYYNNLPNSTLLMRYIPGSLCVSVVEAGYHLEKLFDTQGKRHRDLLDAMRRQDFCKGSYFFDPPVNGWREGACDLFYTGTSSERRRYLSWVKKSHAPFYACPDVFNRKLFRGGELSANISIMNDLPRLVTNAAVRARITTTQGALVVEQTWPAGALKEGEKKRLPVKLSVPVDIPDGSYSFNVAALEGQNCMSGNEYDLTIMGKAGERTTIKATQKVGLYLGATNGVCQGTPDDPAQTEEMLRHFGIPYMVIKDLKSLPSAQVDVLIIGLNSIDAPLIAQGELLADWIKAGHKLLCLEQNIDANMPWCPGLRFSGLQYEMQDFQAPIPHYPVFQGIEPANIYLPNNGRGGRGYYRNFVLPLTKGMMAVGGSSIWRADIGMLLSEHKLGKGLFLVNTIKAVSQYQSDPVIQRYMINLLSYAVSDAWNGEFACEAPVAKFMIKPPKTADCFFVDMASCANSSLRDEKADDKTGGWDDTGPKDMRHFPVGEQVFGGIPFMIVPPEKNQGKSVIVLGDEKNRSYFPREVKGIDVKNQRAKRLFFLVTAAWCGGKNEGEIGRLTVNYAGGSTAMAQAVIPLVAGRNVCDWTIDIALTEALPVWRKKHPVVDSLTAVYAFEWVNPEPQGSIQTIDFLSNGKAVPILLAITGERP